MYQLRGVFLALLLLFVGCSPKPPIGIGSPDETVPLDSRIIKDTLPSGLTFYVIPNKKPEGRASLWLAVHAGSVLEEEDQRGLAHFVEHMAFGGTRRFPGHEITSFLEHAGMSFGADANAYTSFDQTVYQLTVPTDNPSTVLTGLRILRDWAADVTFDPKKVDRERKVILEEWRMGRGAQARLEDKQFPKLFSGSRYGERLPIGEPDIIRSASSEDLRRFYRQWYQPQHMAVIAVGDFEPQEMVQKISAEFGDLARPADSSHRENVPVPNDHPLVVTVATDPEMPSTALYVYNKLPHRREQLRSDFRRVIVEAVYHAVLNERFFQLARNPDAPFASAASLTASLTDTSDGIIRMAHIKEGRTEEALGLILRELRRSELHPFHPGEIERAARTTLSGVETLAADYENTRSSDVADEATRNFFENEGMPGIRAELELYREFLSTVTSAELADLARRFNTDTGRVIAIQAPQHSTLPSEEQVRQIAAAEGSALLPPWEEEVSRTTLMESPPTPGEVVETAHDAATDVTTWTLSNGVKVLVKPTQFKNDEVLFSGFQKGGTSLASDEEFTQLRFAGEIIGSSGVGDFDPLALVKVLAGRQLSVDVGLQELSQYVAGSARPADLETALQLAHLKLVAPRKDVAEFVSWQTRAAEAARNRRLNPEQVFSDDVSSILYSGFPRYKPATVEMIERVDLDKVLELFKLRFRDFNGFTFVFVGNVSLPVLQPLVERYLASLPSSGSEEPSWRDLGVKHVSGKIEKTFPLATEPKSLFYLYSNGPAPGADQFTETRDAFILGKVLDMRLREVLRDGLGGVYWASAQAQFSREPTPRRVFGVYFGAEPGNVSTLRKALLEELGRVKREGVSADTLERVRTQLQRGFETSSKENRWWRDRLVDAAYYREPFEEYVTIEKLLDRVTAENVKATMARFFDEKSYVIAIMKPKGS